MTQNLLTHSLVLIKVIVHLASKLDSIRVPSARAMIIWMLGEYNSMGHIIPKVLPTVLKYLAWTFSSEALETKLQILNAMVKVEHYKYICFSSMSL